MTRYSTTWPLVYSDFAIPQTQLPAAIKQKTWHDFKAASHTLIGMNNPESSYLSRPAIPPGAAFNTTTTTTAY
jgi:hypothetical protein